MLNFIIHKTHLYLTEWPSFNNLWEIPVKVPRLETLNHQVPQWTRFPYGDVVWGCPTCGWKNDPLTLKILTLDAIRICSKLDFYSLQIISIVSVSMMAKTKVIRETFVRIIQFVLTRLLLSFRIYYLKFNPIPGKNCRLYTKIWKINSKEDPTRGNSRWWPRIGTILKNNIGYTVSQWNIRCEP